MSRTGVRTPNAEQPLRAAERAVAAVLNRILLGDEQRAARLARLSGCVIEIGVRDTGWRLYALPGAHGIELARAHAGPPDVRVIGRPADFIAFARSTRRGDTLGAGRIEIAGDLAVAQQVQALLGELVIDWADLLAPLIGEVPAHQLARLCAGALDGARRGARRLESDLSEWLQHEALLAPTRGEVRQFARAVAVLADDVERAAARLRRLARARAGT